MFLIVPASDGQYAFKSGYNRYVGMNISGSLCGYAEAIGALEQWIVQCNPDKTFSFKSATNKFLCSKGNGVLTSKSAKSMDGEPSDDDPTVNLTGLLDDDSVRFKVWTDQPPLMVAKARVTHHEEDVGVLELNTSKKYQSYQGKGATPMVSKEGKKALKIAAKEGRLNEELLERRSKIKADRYCK
ncbi:protein FRG1-like [Zophobas morio]|uniref:protein FRG1-like n=1 Tax=Zophobas morio TaxID=2755281 RepID=UPI0030827DAF